MAEPKKVTVLGFGAYGRPMVRANVVLDYLKGQPIADATLTIEQALRLQIELTKAIQNALACQAERRADEVPF